VTKMRIVPVLDLMGGKVVRGIGGRRDQYRPIVSDLTSSADPVDVAEAFRHHFGLDEIYLADLDAIAGAGPALGLYRELSQCGFQLWVDEGLREIDDVEALLASGVSLPVAGLETIAGLDLLARLRERCGERLVFSLDLKGGRPLAGTTHWPSDPWAIAEAAVNVGVTRLLVLDLAQVGEGRGTGTEDLCRRLARTYPGVEVSAGGGVRGAEDLRRLSECGVSAALVASALHDGRLTPEAVAEFR
jgi:phosphoribosylformimino-5-aminoimidazole carboxamide ribotide isomerase